MYARRTVLGIDPSLTGTAVVVLGQDGWHTSRRYSTPPALGLEARFQRFTILCDSVLATAGEFHPELVLIEGYSFGSRGAGQHDRAEFGGLLRKRLLDEGYRIAEVPPATLKLFACGRGNGDKLAVSLAIRNRYQAEFASHDEFDAYALAALASCSLGWLATLDDKQRRAVATLTDILKQGARS